MKAAFHGFRTRRELICGLSPYARLWTGTVQPFYEQYIRGKDTPRLQRFLDESQWWDRDRLEEHKWRELAVLLEYARAHVPFYREWFGSKGVTVKEIIDGRSMDTLPLVSREMMNARPGHFQSENPPRGSKAHTTGGTTGAPLKFLMSPSSSDWRIAISRRGYEWAGCVPGRRQVHIWSSDVIPPPRLKKWKRNLHRIFLRQKYVNSFKLLRSSDYGEVVTEIDTYRPDCIIAYPTAAAQLARYMIENNKQFRKSPVSMIGGGEALFPAQRELIEKAFECPSFETYGSREFMLTGAECDRHEGMHVSAENIILEIVKDGCSAQAGVLGEVVVTDLHNYAQPFIRYQTGDLSSWRGPACSCGRALPLLNRIEGRDLDIIRSPDGKCLSGHFLPHFVQDMKGIDRFQVVQDRIDHVVVRVVLRGELAANDRQFIVSQIQNYLPGITAEVEEVAEIKPTASGKIRTTICLLNSNDLSGNRL